MNEDWTKRAAAELRNRTPDDLIWQTPEGIDVRPVYGPGDLSNTPHLGSLPGEAPYTRGPKATMYAGRPWTIRQYAGFSTAEESNAFLSPRLWPRVSRVSRSPSIWPPIGATTATIPRVRRCRQGRRGNRLVEDMKILFDGIPLDKVSVSMTMNGAVIPVLASFIVPGKSRA